MNITTLALLSVLSSQPLAVGSGVVVSPGRVDEGQHQMPAGMSHEEHLRLLQKEKELKERGALAMGFDQDKVDHHFLLQPSGGSIVVTVKSASDGESLGQVRSHLREIAQAFTDGTFDKPAETHGELPPGASTMAANRSRLSYQYKERRDGGEVVITSRDAETVRAVHEFLRYQIVEHQTGDPLTPPR